jgi:hypothetical protein
MMWKKKTNQKERYKIPYFKHNQSLMKRIVHFCTNGFFFSPYHFKVTI